MKIIFFGTPEIARECLAALSDSGHEVVLAVTKADKPQGRGYKIEYSPVKTFAMERALPIFQPLRLKDEKVRDFLASHGADMFVTCAYGKIFPPEILKIPPLGCVNVHASLLPRYRGASPINRTLMAGDKTGGVTIMYMDEGMDTGDMAHQKTVEIPGDMDYGGYYELLTQTGKKALLEFLSLCERGAVRREKQNECLATYAPKVEKAEMVLDFTKTAEELFNKIRALSPQPCARAFLSDKMCKIYKAALGNPLEKGAVSPGKVMGVSKNGIEIAASDQSIVITELQPEGKNRMDAYAYALGNFAL